jgi:large subunit ribosomal protein L2
MGKNLIQQARGKGSPRYRAPSFRYRGCAEHKSIAPAPQTGKVIDLITCQGHSAPLAVVEYQDNDVCLLIAPEGIRVGQEVVSGASQDPKVGFTSTLKDIPKGTLIYNIESTPGDGGKFCRAAGTFARILNKLDGKDVIMLPSKKTREFQPECRANIGVVAGGGKPEKPFLKAGTRFYAMKAKNKVYPIVSGSAQNAVDHPFGNKRTSRKSKARPAPKNAPPGRNVGMLHPRRTGRRKK